MARTVPAAATQSPGLYQTSALWNAQVRDLNNFALGPPVFRGYQTIAQSCPNATWFNIALDTEAIDSDGGHSTITNTSRYTPTVPGTYLAIGSAAFNPTATTQRACRLTLNGNASVGGADAGACGAGWWAGTCIEIFTCNGTTDYIEIQGRQDSGGSLSTYVGTDFASALKVYWISR
ncbi:hypothetical protein PL81_38710 [Streptomyces sp. RSD-27]|nr:hypothetical protein PL81_38710 [Streptomyces sp. RSD-27]